MHASEAFILTVVAAFVGGVRLQFTPHNIGEKIILLQCVSTLFLLVLSVIMKIKGQTEATIGFAVGALGIMSAWFLLPTLAMAR
jgi:hypothetical protein